MKRAERDAQRMRALALTAAVALAGCLFPSTTHHVHVFNGTDAPVSVSVVAVDTLTRAAEFGHAFMAVQPSQGLQVEHRFRNERPYAFEASTIGSGPDGGSRANGTFEFHQGSWAVSIHVDRNGALSLSSLHGD